MLRTCSIFSSAGGLVLLLALVAPVQAQQGHIPGDDMVRPWGQGVAPVFEGWYEHPDEGYVISFGYLNRNSDEVVEIPHGTQNFVEPAEFDGGQPTHFGTRRHYGMFVVRVPEDFGDEQIVWTIDFRGERYEIPGYVTNPNYEIDAMHVPATGTTPPYVRFSESGETFRGPHGTEISRTTSVGEPLEFTVWTRDDTWDTEGEIGVLGEEIEAHTVTLRWYKLHGPGEVSFSQSNIRLQKVEDGFASGTTSVTFSEPGDYRIYVRANNESLTGAGQEQCCWTNGYVDVTVQQ